MEEKRKIEICAEGEKMKNAEVECNAGELHGEDWRFCKKCLIRDFDAGELFRTMQDYIARIEEDIKTPQKEYESRLKLCTECENLLNGMCRVCGCYVEMRAAVRNNYCPEVRPKW